MKHKPLFIIITLLGFSFFCDRPVPTQEIPASVLKAFREEHPLARKALYRFESGDAGMLFLVEFQEAGQQMRAEYFYDTQEWINDLGSEVVVTSLDDQDTSHSFSRDLKRTQF